MKPNGAILKSTKELLGKRTSNKSRSWIYPRTTGQIKIPTNAEIEIKL